MSDSMKTFVFALVLSLVCSALLAVVSAKCQPLYEENKKQELKVNTLNALGVEVPEGAEADAVTALYADKVAERKSAEGKVIAYAAKDSSTGEIAAIAFPVHGAGLWGAIGGMVALDSDLKTFKGVRFFDHVETPGLGAEIDKPWFQDQFIGKRAVDDEGRVQIKVVAPGAAKGPYEVDGISGATITGDGVTELLQREISEFVSKNR